LRTLALTGRVDSVATLEDEWRQAADVHVRQAAARAKGEAPELQMMRDARAEIARTGGVAAGDLVYIIGDPPRIGHFLPPHYNAALGRQCNGDVAITTPFRMRLIAPEKLPSTNARTAALGVWPRSLMVSASGARPTRRLTGSMRSLPAWPISAGRLSG
jgi:hypothetical protein